ncbi:MAG: aminotransferase class V-fold PLP-dependent enzyme [Ilumatobacteraceae bacterium]
MTRVESNPSPPVVYLDGNSLGRPSPGLADRLARFVDGEWATSLIGGWSSEGWWDLPLTVGDRIGRLIGAAAGQVVVGESTSVWWYKLLRVGAGFGVERIVVEDGAFPTDRYLVDAVASEQGLEVVVVPRFRLVDEAARAGTLVACCHVDYRSGERADLRAIGAVARASGSYVLTDLSHSVGAMELRLDDDGIDLAVGCTYKYLAAGPGAPAFAYVAARHLGAAQPIPGWIGHREPFAMADVYAPADGIRSFLSGTPPVLSLVALDHALDRFDGLDGSELRRRSLSLTEEFLRGADELLAPHGFEPVTPRDAERRGSQVSLRHPEAWGFVQAAIEDGVIGDFRAPDLARFGFAPIDTTAQDVAEALTRLARLAADPHRWQGRGRPDASRAATPT